MSDVTRILGRIKGGDGQAADQLLPIVYGELRRLAAAKMAQENPGQTLQPTALVHEAYIRLVDRDQGQDWDSQGHFFAAAAEAMRRILIENARQKACCKRGGGCDHSPPMELDRPSPDQVVDLLDLDQALTKLEQHHPEKARVVNLRFFGGCSLEETAELLGLSRATVQRHWAYARAWLFGQLHGP